MIESPADRLDAIHSLLAAGQRNLRIERHSLLLWGLSGGGLMALSEHILTPEQLPDLAQRAVAWLATIVAVLGLAAIADWRLTRRAKAARDEAWSFIHRQVLKVWWLMMAIGALLTFAMFFFGGGYMVCSAWLVVLGVGLYVHGLFSEELLEWSGALVILIGIASLAAGLPYTTMKWITASVFAIGLPLLALLLDRGRPRPAWWRLGQSLAWLLLVLLPPLIAHRIAEAKTTPNIVPLSFETFSRQGAASGTQIVTLPAGTAIPVHIEVAGNVFTANQPVLPLTLAIPVELLMQDGKPTGDARLPDGSWSSARQGRWISIPWIRGDLTAPEGPAVRAGLIVNLGSPTP